MGWRGPLLRAPGVLYSLPAASTLTRLRVQSQLFLLSSNAQ
jgi:hypothetical protein